MFCRIHWQANDYGTICWQLMVMQACTPLDAAHPRRAARHAPAAARRGRTRRTRRAGAARRHRGAEHRAPPTCRPRTGARSATGSQHACRCQRTPPSGTPLGWPGGCCHDDRSRTCRSAGSSLARTLAPRSRTRCASAPISWPNRAWPRRQRVVLARNLLATLRTRELEQRRRTLPPKPAWRIGRWPKASAWPASTGAMSCSPAGATPCSTIAGTSRWCRGSR